MPFFFSSSSIITIKSSSSRRLIHPSHQAMAPAKQRVLKITLNLKQQIIIFFCYFFLLWIIASVEFICASEETVLNEFQDVNALYFSFILSIPPLQCFYLSVNFQCLKEANICPRIIRINEQKKEYFLRDFLFSKEKAFRILISSSILIYCICMMLVKEVKGEKGMK